MNETPTQTPSEAPPRIVILVATIPARQRSCERLLAELARQAQRPDGVILVLDGYGGAPAPACPLPVIAEHRTEALSGAGARWNAAADLPPEDIVICLDDDIMLLEAPALVRALVAEVKRGGGAAAAMGFSADGKRAPPGIRSRGALIYGAGCGLTVRAKHLIGLQAFATEVRTAGGPDALGVGGDDDALVSAYLWKTGIALHHAATGNIFPAPGTRKTSQTAAKAAARREPPNAQKLALKRITGWPWYAGLPPKVKASTNARVVRGRP